MCGRVTLTTKGYEALLGLLDAEADPADAALYRPRYNVAPTDLHWQVRASAGKRRLEPARWGLPRSSPAGGVLVNARAETVAKQLRRSFAERRCLVPADGFFEWTGPRKARRPFWFHRPGSALLLLAGVYEPGPGERPCFTVVTTAARGEVARIHDRMPFLLSEEGAREWLETSPRDAERLLHLPVDVPLLATEVSPRVNSVANDDESCLAAPGPTEPPEPRGQLGLF